VISELNDEVGQKKKEAEEILTLKKSQRKKKNKSKVEPLNLQNPELLENREEIVEKLESFPRSVDDREDISREIKEEEEKEAKEEIAGNSSGKIPYIC